MAMLEATTLPEATIPDGIDATILTALAPTQHVYQPLPAIHHRSGVPVDDLRRRLRRLERAGYVHRLRTDVASLQDHYCLSTAGQTHADSRPG